MKASSFPASAQKISIKCLRILQLTKFQKKILFSPKICNFLENSFFSYLGFPSHDTYNSPESNSEN